MDEVSRREVTILFVSHNMGVLASLCPLAIWLDHGPIRQQGFARSVIGDYLAHGGPNQDRLLTLGQLPREHVDGEDRLRLDFLEWLCDLPLR
jgi:ABC-type multidrug transport system ATPase subunit